MDGKHGFIYPSRIGLKIIIRIKYFYLKKYQPEGWYLYDLRHTLHFIPDTYFTVLSIRRANLCHGMKVRRWIKSLNLCLDF